MVSLYDKYVWIILPLAFLFISSWEHHTYTFYFSTIGTITMTIFSILTQGATGFEKKLISHGLEETARLCLSNFLHSTYGLLYLSIACGCLLLNKGYCMLTCITCQTSGYFWHFFFRLFLYMNNWNTEIRALHVY
jgi:general stress protein CsbA